MQGFSPAPLSADAEGDSEHPLGQAKARSAAETLGMGLSGGRWHMFHYHAKLPCMHQIFVQLNTCCCCHPCYHIDHTTLRDPSANFMATSPCVMTAHYT